MRPRGSQRALWVPWGSSNLANTPGGSSGILTALWSCAVVLIHFDDPGVPQGSRGPLGVADLLSRTLAVHRVILGAPQGSFGSPRGSGGRRPHRSARHRHSYVLLLEFGKSQPEKEGIYELMFTQCFEIDASAGFALPFKRLTSKACIEPVLARGNQQTIRSCGNDFIGME